MELRDFIVTPIVLFLVYALAYWIRPKVTDANTRKFFFPALTLKIIGALAVGFIYQFYYDGGDTFNYHTYGSRIIWEAFIDDPGTGLRLIFSDNTFKGDLFVETRRILFYNDPNSYFVVRVSAFIDILTFSAYSATSVIFAVFSFGGLWALYMCFSSQFVNYQSPLSLAILFLPSVVFWGSGILKDTLTIGALGWMIYAFHKIIFKGQRKLSLFLIFISCFYIILIVKKYILICLIPAILLWIFAKYSSKIHSMALKVAVVPLLFVIVIAFCYLAVDIIVKEDTRYSFENLAETTRITAYDIGFYTGRNAGSGYNLGELDGTFQSMIRLFPAAVNVALFRPYLWEVKNPLMLISALESFVVFFLTLYITLKVGLFRLFKYAFNPFVFFCLVFSITFAFAVGVSTFNFGTLVRYKIPLMPFYLSAIVIIYYQWKRDKKLEVLALTE